MPNPNSVQAVLANIEKHKREDLYSEIYGANIVEQVRTIEPSSTRTQPSYRKRINKMGVLGAVKQGVIADIPYEQQKRRIKSPRNIRVSSKHRKQRLIQRHQ